MKMKNMTKKWKKDELRWFVFCFVQKSLTIFFSPYFWQDLYKKGIAFITRVTGLRLGLGGVGTNNTDFKESLSGRRVNQLSYLIAESRRTFLYTIILGMIQNCSKFTVGKMLDKDSSWNRKALQYCYLSIKLV